MPVRIHRTRRLEDEDWKTVEGIPVTAIARTLLDMAAAVRFERLEKLVERAEERGLFDLRQMEDLLARTVGHHGHGVELDVFETHGTRAAFERDRKRQEDLLLRGITMTRVTGPRLEREPGEVIERVARLLSAQAPRHVSSTPSGV
jgi:hypothetical protein